MQKQSRISTAYLIPSIADILFLAILGVLFFVHRSRLLCDCDTGYHIRAGDFIIKNLTVPTHDIFSFHAPPLPWTAHEWLSEIVMAALHAFWGLSGVVAFFSFVLALTTYLLFKTLREYGMEIILATAVTLLALTSFQLHWLARPHAFSFLFMVVFQYLLESWHRETFNRLKLLPPMMLLWVNLHGGFIGGFILMGAYLIGYAVSALGYVRGKQPERYGASLRKFKELAVVMLACLGVCLVNPRGYHILLFPFRLVSETFLMDHISEFLSPNFHEWMPFKYLLLLLVGLVAFSRRRMEPTEVVLLLVFTNMSLYSVRYIPLFALVTAPILARLADENRTLPGPVITGFLTRRSETLTGIDANARGCLWPVLGTLIIFACAITGSVQHGFDPKTKPVAASEFLMREKIPGNMFNDDEFGDYLIYRSKATYKVFIDGRSDMYGTQILKEYYKVINFEQGWERVLDKYRIDWIFFDTRTALSRYLLNDKNWVLIYSDSVANIFVRNLPKYQKLIEKYPSVKPAAL